MELDGVWEVSPVHGSLVHACCCITEAPTSLTEINRGKEANRLGKSIANRLNPLCFVLEAGLKFVHPFYERLSLKSFPYVSF